jgi:hypothetical protein
MRRLIWLAAAALALLGAGIAVAHEGEGKSVAKVSATFTATTASNVSTSSCTGSDGTYVSTRGRWTGSSTGDPSLTGNTTIDAESLINTTTGVGTVSGHMRIDVSGGGHTTADFDAVYSGGHIAGLAEGRGSASWKRLIANLSADWPSTGGFANGKLGGTTGGDAVVVSSGGCRPAQVKPETIVLRGAVTLGANNATITVAGVSCNVPSNLASSVGSLHNGDRVEAKCTSASGTNTLVSINGDHHGDDHHH